MGQGQVPSSTGMPPKQQAIIIGGLTLCLLVGGGIVYWLIFGGGPRKREISVDPSTPSRSAPRLQQMAPMPGIRVHGNNDWSVRGQVGEVRIKRTDDGKFDMSYVFVSGLNPPAEKVDLFLRAHRATRDDAMAEEWGISPDEQKQLKAALSRIESPTLTQGERDALSQIFEQYLKASGPPARNEVQKQLKAKIDEVVKGKVQPALDAIDRRDMEIRAILKSGQIEKMLKK